MPIAFTVKTTKNSGYETIKNQIKAGKITLKSASVILNTTTTQYYSISVEIGTFISGAFVVSDDVYLNFLDILLEQNIDAATNVLSSLSYPDISFDMSGDLDTTFVVRVYNGIDNQLIPSGDLIFLGLQFQVDY